MKSYLREHFYLNLFVLLFVSLFSISCNKDESNSTDPSSGSSSSYITCKVNGVAMNFTQETPVGYYYSTNNKTYVTSHPSGFTHPEINLGFPGKATGTFTESDGAFLDYTDANDVDYYYEPSTCSVTVTQYGDVGSYIVGTFTATKHSSSSTATITEGRFSVQRTY